MALESSEAKNTTQAAISDGLAILFSLLVHAPKHSEEMEYRSIYFPDNQWAVLHSLWDEDQTALGEYMLFILQP
jgi:hypothetical protein